MNRKNIIKFKTPTFAVVIVISLLIIYIHLSSHNKTQQIYIGQTEKIIMDMKKDFLEDTVNNIFTEIDKLRKTKIDIYNKNIEYRIKRIEDEFDLTDSEFIDFFIDKFENDTTAEMWSAILWDDTTGEIIYASKELDTSSLDEAKKYFNSSETYKPSFEKNNLKGILTVKDSYIEDVVKKEIGDSIRNREFSNDSYIWVNEVINYEGGDDYAIRKIHPNRNEDEGVYLSTNMKDIKGNFPYKEELEGINQDGELFFNYFFEKLNSTEISEKLTYAKLYKDYDWIIAMGVHLDDIDAYIETVNEETVYSSTEYTMKLLRYLFVVLIIGFTILYFLEKRNLLSSTRSLEEKVNVDTLTKASSRRAGENILNYFFNKYRLKGKNSAVMMFDVDDFKGVNDTYGHDVGDIVLIEIVKAISKVMRESDTIIRWGGDEFVGIFPDLKESNLITFGQRILDEIASIEVPVKNGTINISISIGFSYFNEDDESYNDVLKRVDKSMYQAKQEGKNKFKI